MNLPHTSTSAFQVSLCVLLCISGIHFGVPSSVFSRLSNQFISGNIKSLVMCRGYILRLIMAKLSQFLATPLVSGLYRHIDHLFTGPFDSEALSSCEFSQNNRGHVIIIFNNIVTNHFTSAVSLKQHGLSVTSVKQILN